MGGVQSMVLRQVLGQFPMSRTMRRRAQQLNAPASGIATSDRHAPQPGAWREVIIETQEHDKTLSTMPIKRVEDVIWAFRDRMIDLKKDKRFKYILLFKNHGESAGATLQSASVIGLAAVRGS